MTNVSLKISTRECVPDNHFLGYEGENEVNKLVFKFEDGFFDGAGVLNVKKGDARGYLTLDKVDETYELPIRNSLISQNGEVTFQLTITTVDGMVVKFDPFVMMVKDAIDTDAEMPDEYPSWIDYANAKLVEIDVAIDTANNVSSELLEAKENGEFKGEKGDKGDKGDAGSVKFIVVAELPIENIDESAIYMKSITESEEQNKYEEFIYVNGQWESLGIAQVEVNLDEYAKQNELESLKEYTNILAQNVTELATQRVSFTDYASSSKAGVVIAKSDNGIGVSATGDYAGQLFIVPANKSQIDVKTNTRNPITPSVLAYAVESVVGKHVTLTQAEYDALETKDDNTYYFIEEE